MLRWLRSFGGLGLWTRFRSGLLCGLGGGLLDSSFREKQHALLQYVWYSTLCARSRSFSEPSIFVGSRDQEELQQAPRSPLLHWAFLLIFFLFKKSGNF